MRQNPHNDEKPRQRHGKIYSNSKCIASIQLVFVVCLALDTYHCLHVFGNSYSHGVTVNVDVTVQS